MSTPLWTSKSWAYWPSPVGISARIVGAASTSTPPLGDVVQSGVITQGVVSEVTQLGQRLDAGKTTADEHKSQVLAAALGVRLDRRQEAQQTVAQVEGIEDGGAAHRVLRQPGDGEGAGDSAHANDDVVVPDAEAQAPVGLDLGVTVLEREVSDPPLDNFGVGAYHRQRRHHVAHLDDTRRYLGQHGSEKHRILWVDYRRSPPAEEPCHICPSKAPAHDEHSAPGRPRRIRRAHTHGTAPSRSGSDRVPHGAVSGPPDGSSGPPRYLLVLIGLILIGACKAMSWSLNRGDNVRA